ncbi:MAG: DUF488 domain-containing protein [Planctomycetota bacterium]|nr:DUF488 domain-containing protein [Planctomycetota bacterium]
MEIYTIGFTQTTAGDFFERLNQAGVRRLVDVRLNNVSQLAGFAKRDDLRYFLKALCQGEYAHEPLLAPTKAMLDAYKKQKGSWQLYEQLFLQLLADRQVEVAVGPELFDVPTVLLCSEPTAEHCHRRLVLEYLRDKWGHIEMVHL